MPLKIYFSNECSYLKEIPVSLNHLRELIERSLAKKLKNTHYDIYYIDSDQDKIFLNDEDDFQAYQIFHLKLQNSICKLHVQESLNQSYEKINIDEQKKQNNSKDEFSQILVVDEIQIAPKKNQIIIEQEEEDLQKINNQLDEIKIEEEQIQEKQNIVEEENIHLKENVNFPLIEEEKIPALQQNPKEDDLKIPNRGGQEENQKSYKHHQKKMKIKKAQANLEHNMISNQVVHQNIECDNCGISPIRGVRYKCLVCDNFDFCENCENTIEHQHAFLKIRKPKSNQQSGLYKFLENMKKFCRIGQNQIVDLCIYNDEQFNQFKKMNDAINQEQQINEQDDHDLQKVIEQSIQSQNEVQQFEKNLEEVMQQEAKERELNQKNELKIDQQFTQYLEQIPQDQLEVPIQVRVINISDSTINSDKFSIQCGEYLIPLSFKELNSQQFSNPIILSAQVNHNENPQVKISLLFNGEIVDHQVIQLKVVQKTYSLHVQHLASQIHQIIGGSIEGLEKFVFENQDQDLNTLVETILSNESFNQMYP